MYNISQHTCSLPWLPRSSPEAAPRRLGRSHDKCLLDWAPLSWSRPPARSNPAWVSKHSNHNNFRGNRSNNIKVDWRTKRRCNAMRNRKDTLSQPHCLPRHAQVQFADFYHIPKQYITSHFIKTTATSPPSPCRGSLRWAAPNIG